MNTTANTNWPPVSQWLYQRRTRDGRETTRTPQHAQRKNNQRRACGLLTSLPAIGARQGTGPHAEKEKEAQHHPTMQQNSTTTRITARQNANTIATFHTETRAQLHTLGRAIRTAGPNHAHLLDRAIGLAEDLSAAIGNKVQNSSHWQYWTDFMKLMGEDAESFGSSTHAPQARRRIAQEKEMTTIKRFLSDLVFKPIRRNKKHNSVSYSRKVIASIREEYSRHYNRTIGIPGSDFNQILGRLEKGIRKVAPSEGRPTIPVLQYHMWSVKRTLHLQTNPIDRVLWAMWCTQLQGVLRAGDLIRPTAEAARKWDLNLDTHRGRVSFQHIRGEPHADGKMRMKIDLKPTKTDQAGEKKYIKSFVVMGNTNALSAGDAVQHMLQLDPIPGYQK